MLGSQGVDDRVLKPLFNTTGTELEFFPFTFQLIKPIISLFNINEFELVLLSFATRNVLTDTTHTY